MPAVNKVPASENALSISLGPGSSQPWLPALSQWSCTRLSVHHRKNRLHPRLGLLHLFLAPDHAPHHLRAVRVAQVFPPPCRVVFLRRLLDLHQPHSLGCKYLWRTLLRTLAYQGARGLLLTLQGSSFTSCYVRVSYAFHHGATADIPNSSFPHGFYQSIHFSWPAHSLAYPSRCLRSGTFVSPPSQ